MPGFIRVWETLRYINPLVEPLMCAKYNTAFLSKPSSLSFTLVARHFRRGKQTLVATSEEG